MYHSQIRHTPNGDVISEHAIFVGEQSSLRKRGLFCIQLHQTVAFIILKAFGLFWPPDHPLVQPHSQNVVGEPGLGHSAGLRGRKTGLPGEERQPGESRGGQAEGQVPGSWSAARRLRLPHEAATERAKIL